MTIKGFYLLMALIFIAGKTTIAQKTDKVILMNGDHITGEIKRLDLDILQLKTSTMSIAKIKWYQVKNLYAPDKSFRIELEDKTKLFGNLDSTSTPSILKIKSALGQYEVATKDVVTIYQVKQLFWSRFSGSLSAGVSYTKASDILQTNGAGNLSYTEERYFGSLGFDVIQTLQHDSIYTAKKDALLNFNKTMRTNQFITTFLTAQENTELGIQLRTGIGMGYGMDIVHTSVSRIRFIGAMTGNREQGLGEAPTTNNAEGLVKLDVKVFKYTDPEVYVDAFVNWYPSLTVTGRHRIEAEVQIRFELFNDLFLEFKIYSNYDNKPISTSSSNTDYGLISRFTYTFGL